MPLHVIQMKTPRFVDAHRGDGPLQSAHDLFSGSVLCEMNEHSWCQQVEFGSA